MTTRLPLNLMRALALASVVDQADRIEADAPPVIFLPRPEPSEPQRRAPGQLTPGRRMTGRKARRLKRRGKP